MPSKPMPAPSTTRQTRFALEPQSVSRAGYPWLASPSHRSAARIDGCALTAGLALEKAVGGALMRLRIRSAELDPASRMAISMPLMAAMADFNTEAVGDRYATMAETFARTTREPHFGTASSFRPRHRPADLLAEMGINPAQFDRFAEMAANDPGALANPRRLTPGDCRRILEAAW